MTRVRKESIELYGTIVPLHIYEPEGTETILASDPKDRFTGEAELLSHLSEEELLAYVKASKAIRKAQAKIEAGR